jgi:hypothetical protein
VSAIFSKVLPDEMKIPFPRVEALIDAYGNNQRTGIIRLAYEGGNCAYFFFKHGMIINVCMVKDSKYEQIPVEEWQTRLRSEGDTFARPTLLSPFGLLIAKILLQTPEDPAGRRKFSPSEFFAYLESLKGSKELSLLDLVWGDSHAAIFFPGNTESIHSIYLNAGEFRDDPGIPEVFDSLGQTEVIVTRLKLDPSLDAWQEYVLRRGFADICERTLARFESMAGRALVDSLIRLVVVFASRRGLDISIFSRRLIDREIFSSPSQAAEQYRELLKEMFSHFSVVIGSRLLSSTLREIIASLPAEEQEIIHTYSLIPEGYHYA